MKYRPPIIPPYNTPVFLPHFYRANFTRVFYTPYLQGIQ
nr:MAG TPA: hypothetical protein [Caudoviricetes sp.]